MAYKAAVIGAGMIGAKMDAAGEFPPQTHAGAYRAHEAFTLMAICDPLATKDLGEKFGCAVYPSTEAMLTAIGAPDIVSVAVTPQQQPDILMLLAGAGVRAVVAEKPLAQDLREAQNLAALYAEKHIPLIVNYSRRFLPFYADLAKRLQSEAVLNATIKYAKGLLHNGSHAIDLLRMLFGEVRRAVPLAARVDYSDADPTMAVFMEMDHCPMVFLQPLDDRAFTLFEVDIVTRTGRYQIYNDHRDCHVWRVEDKAGIPPGRRLIHKDVIMTGHSHALLNLVDNAAAVLAGRAAPLCTAEDAIKAQQVIERIRGSRTESNLV